MKGCLCFGARIPEETACEMRKNIKIARWILPDCCDASVYEKGISQSLLGKMPGEDTEVLNLLKQEKPKLEKERRMRIHNPVPVGKQLTIIMELSKYNDLY
ncbi:hypothetical protein Q3G72_023765 [Acer saccharum]|nr:hypothetical protein Q3G72_023765 [Acer saccharum]